MVIPELGAWEPWDPHDVAARLSGVDAPWCAAAGWALDLFLGERTREHTDLEIAIPAGRFDEVRDRLPELHFFAVDRGTLVPLAAGEAPVQADLAAVLPRLSGDRRRWLASALARVHPGHPWLDRLAGTTQIENGRYRPEVRDQPGRG